MKRGAIPKSPAAVLRRNGLDVPFFLRRNAECQGNGILHFYLSLISRLAGQVDAQTLEGLFVHRGQDH